jgi:hypothetical protein
MSSEIPLTSDKAIWSEDGRLHIKYTNCTSDENAAQDVATITVNDTLDPATNPLQTGGGQIAVRAGQTIILSANDGSGSNKGIITSVDLANATFEVAYFEAGGQVFGASTACTMMIYGSEFKKGTAGMSGSLEANDEIFNNTPIISKDNYEVSGSDMAQIGWVEVELEDEGGLGYLWYLKSKGETRMRFEDYMESSMLEAVPAEANSGAVAAGYKGTEGVFYTVNDRGNVFGAGSPSSVADFDSVLKRLDKQGSIEQNMMYLERDASLNIDDMLASQNSYGAGGTSWGAFNNSKDMGMNLGFTDFRRGSYDFYKSDWKYLNDATMRGGLSDGWSGSTTANTVTGLMVPSGSKNVYDENLGSKVRRPFLHVRYRASATTNRRYKTWITGGGQDTGQTDDLDVMTVNFLTERCVCTLGANNFFLFRYG